MSAPVFSLIIPVCNKWELTKNCLHSIREHTAATAFEVIVVDNASTDATATELSPLGHALFPGRFTVIRNASNLNFGPASNLGAHRAQGELLFFLNNDTLVTPGWSQPLLGAFHERPDLGAAGPLLLYPDQRVQHLGVTFAPQGISHLYSLVPHDHPVVRRPRRLQAITAAALMMPASLFRQCGGFYEGYVNGHEDMELSLRIRQQGHILACISASTAYHLESQTPGRKDTERHNTQLLHKRCGEAFFVDLHHHALRDGFALRIDEEYGLRMVVAPQESAELLAQTAGKDEDALASALTAHPLWLEGHIALAKRLESRNSYAQACAVWLRVARILPSLATCQALAHAAHHAGEPETTRQAETVAATLRAQQENPQAALARLQTILRHAHKHNDQYLAGLYQPLLGEQQRRSEPA